MYGLLNGRVCLITGAGQGIGKAIASLFAEEGATVYVNDVCEGSADEWIAADPCSERLKAVYFNITDTAAIRANLTAIKKAEGHIDVLVNNAGVEYNELIGMISQEHLEKMFSVNVFGTINMLQLTSRIMSRQQDGGSIINIASMVGLRGNAGQLGYSATKGAVIALTKSAAKELAPQKIRVNAIAPGLTKTKMMDAAAIEKLERRISNICMGRLAMPEDIAKGCLMLASDLSGYVSGQILAVDGCTII